MFISYSSIINYIITHHHNQISITTTFPFMLGMSCANCALRIENTVGKLSGVTVVTVSVMTNRAKVAVDETINNYVGTRDIIDKVVNMGYTCPVESINGVMMNGSSSSGRDDAQNGSSNELKAWYWPLSISILFGTIMMLLNIAMNVSHDVMMAMNMPCACNGSVNLMQLCMLFLNLPIMIFVGYRYYKAAWMGAMHGAYGIDRYMMSTYPASLYSPPALPHTWSDTSLHCLQK